MSAEHTVSISIARDFSRYPAGRYLEDGEFSGARFREKFLVPHLKERKMLEITLDEVAGFGSSFLEEAFGGLVRKEGMEKEFLEKHLKIRADEDDMQDFVKLIKKYIKEAECVRI